MTNLQATQNHRIFHVAVKGDTLVVIPQGDAAGFSRTDFRLEVARIRRLIQQRVFKHLVLDCSHARYFGRLVMNVIAEWSELIRCTGGRVAYCELSDDMWAGLHLQGSDTTAEYFDTRFHALRAVSHETLKQQLRSNAGALATVGMVLMGFLIYNYYPFPNRDVEYYEAITSIWNRYQDLHRHNADREELAAFRSSAQSELKSLVKQLERTASSTEDAKRNMLWAGRNGLLDILREDQLPAIDDPRVHAMCLVMNKARNVIAKKGRQVKPFVRIVSPLTDFPV